jgi:hypothetical protein
MPKEKLPNNVNSGTPLNNPEGGGKKRVSVISLCVGNSDQALRACRPAAHATRASLEPAHMHSHCRFPNGLERVCGRCGMCPHMKKNENAPPRKRRNRTNFMLNGKTLEENYFSENDLGSHSCRDLKGNSSN